MKGKQGSFLPRANDWRIAPVWNEALGNKRERPLQERDRIWASELGKAPIDTFLKMRAVAESNPPNPRAQRKFKAGNFFEKFIGYILKIMGILKMSQKYVVYQYADLLQVSGKIDFIAGGIPEYDGWKEKLSEFEKFLLEDYLEAVEAIVEHLRTKYPEGLADTYLEIKSCSSFSMNSMERTGKASRNHRLQLFHYLKAENFPRGLIVYVCRDDMRIFEYAVQNPDEETEAEYRGAIELITNYFNLNKKLKTEDFLIKPDSSDELKWTYNPEGITTLPPLEPFIVWDKDYEKFARNWGVEYSNYLSMLYGFPTQLEFEEAVNPTVTRWNAALKRLKKIEARKEWLESHNATEENVCQDKIEGTRRKGKEYIVPETFQGSMKELLESPERIELPDEIQGSTKLSPLNLESIEEMKREGFKVEELVKEFAGEGELEEEAL